MTQQAEGSKAMTIYIVICFVLAAGALLAYKVMNDKRTELAAEYRARFQNVVDIQAALAPSIQDYYRRVANKEIRTVDKNVKDSTPTALREIAKGVGSGILEDTGVNDRLDIEPDTQKTNKQQRYIEYGCTVTLKNVTQSEWALFLRNVLDPFDSKNVLDDYVTVASIEAVHLETNYKKMAASESQPGGTYRDASPWKVTIKFIWFATMDEASQA
jgi:hypothetical protein